MWEAGVTENFQSGVWWSVKDVQGEDAGRANTARRADKTQGKGAHSRMVP